jgi:hypothetical protein
MRRLWIAVAAAGTLTACSAPVVATTMPARSSAPATTRATATRPLSPTPSPSPSPAAVTVTTVRMKDGSKVTVATFAGPMTYVLHDGSEDPGLAAGRVKAGPVVRGAERGRLLAAFNGGFKLSAGAGGYEQEGHLAARLRRGLTSLVIDRSGRARIGVWGHGVPVPGESVYSVRQNLTPLVLNGKPTPAAADWSVWGATLGGGEFVARSALGQDASGDLEYAASMSASPASASAARPGRRISSWPGGPGTSSPSWLRPAKRPAAGGLSGPGRPRCRRSPCP